MLITPALLEELVEEHKKGEEIDLEEMPAITDFSGFVRGRFYRPLKEAISIRIDSDVLAWLRTLDEPYQTRVNRILRQYMESSLAKRPAR